MCNRATDKKKSFTVMLDATLLLLLLLLLGQWNDRRNIYVIYLMIMICVIM